MTDKKEQQRLLEVMDRILELSRASQSKDFAPSVAKEIESIQYLRDRVTEQWPLPKSIISDIYIGPYAARNLADWTPNLAHLIMTLDYVLKHNGDGVDELLTEVLREGGR